MKEIDFGIEQTGVKAKMNEICNECIWIILSLSLIRILGRTPLLHRRLALARISRDSHTVLRTVIEEVH
jgi:hypothetical protein